MSKLYAAIDVYRLLAGGAKEYIPNAEVKFYNALDDSLLATVNAGSHGVVMPGQLAGISQATPIYYEYIESGVHYRGGQNVTTEFLYQDIIVAADPHATFYPVGNEQPQAIEVSIRDASMPGAAWQVIGTYARTVEAAIPLGTFKDKMVEMATVSIAPDGTRSHAEISHAPRATVQVQRVTSAPTLAQVGTSTEISAQVEVTGFDARYVLARNVQIASNNLFTTALVDFVDEGQAAISPSIFLGGSASDTRYLRVRHSSTGNDGPWSEWSNVLVITFADAGGTGGSQGSGNGYGGGYYEY